MACSLTRAVREADRHTSCCRGREGEEGGSCPHFTPSKDRDDDVSSSLSLSLSLSLSMKIAFLSFYCGTAAHVLPVFPSLSLTLFLASSFVSLLRCCCLSLVCLGFFSFFVASSLMLFPFSLVVCLPPLSVSPSLLLPFLFHDRKWWWEITFLSLLPCASRPLSLPLFLASSFLLLLSSDVVVVSFSLSLSLASSFRALR